MNSIVIVEDEDRIRKLYTGFLADQGYDVSSFSSAEEAYDGIKEKNIDLMLLDINLGQGVAGDELSRVMHMFKRKTKVIVSSVYSVEDQKKLISSAFDYFDKASGVKVLLEKVKKALCE